MRTVFVVSLCLVLIGGCSSDTDTSSESTVSPTSFTISPDSSPTDVSTTRPVATWTIVGLGDSFTATQNSKGQTYLELFAASLEQTTGRTVTVADLSDDAGTTARVADRLRTGEVTRAAVAAADIILVSVGGNDSDPFAVYPDGTCSPSQPAPDCLAVYSPTFVANYEAILSEIESLRAGRPTAIRVTSADNPFVGWSLAPSATFGIDFYAQVAAAQTQAACAAATAHGGLCVDYLHIFGGPDGTSDPAPYLGPDHAHPGDVGIQAIADELVRLGVPELE